MISSDQWINLPVGYNLDDHVGVSHDKPKILILRSDTDVLA